jgi:hypothetical protein
VNLKVHTKKYESWNKLENQHLGPFKQKLLILEIAFADNLEN